MEIPKKKDCLPTKKTAHQGPKPNHLNFPLFIVQNILKYVYVPLVMFVLMHIRDNRTLFYLLSEATSCLLVKYLLFFSPAVSKIHNKIMKRNNSERWCIHTECAVWNRRVKSYWGKKSGQCTGNLSGPVGEGSHIDHRLCTKGKQWSTFLKAHTGCRMIPLIRHTEPLAPVVLVCTIPF